MYCPNCLQPNPSDAHTCAKCRHETKYFREQVYIGRQFIFVQASQTQPIALEVDGMVQVYRQPTVLSRHRHAVQFGDTAESKTSPLPDQPKLPLPALKLHTIVTDRKIYQPTTDATLFLVAPDAPEQEVNLEVQLAGQKVYEAKVKLDGNGLALHQYVDMKEGEYTAVLTLPTGNDRATCTFSVAEYTLSPLIATLKKHEFADRTLRFTLRLLLLSQPYTGPAELGLQCQVCGNRIVATQTAQAKDGQIQGEFDISGHGGPFHVQITTPDGNTAMINFPNTGAVERQHIKLNPLGQTADLGLLPWANAQPVRGLYVGQGGIEMTPLLLENVVGENGRLQAASAISTGQIITFNPRTAAVAGVPTEPQARSGDRPEPFEVIDMANMARGDVLSFPVHAPYTLFTVGVFNKDKPFEGWGVVIKPVALEGKLTTPQNARPGEEVDVYVDSAVPAMCWLLVYDARLEHESPLPKLAKQIYESVRNATSNLAAKSAVNAREWQQSVPGDFVRGGAPTGLLRQRTMAKPKAASPLRGLLEGAQPLAMAAFAMPPSPAPAAMDMKEAAEPEVMEMVMSPTRMEFPELAFQDFFHVHGQAARTVRLGDQIGTWRVRAYLFSGVDAQELTQDVQAGKPLYAEPDLPAITSDGDHILAAVNYFTRETAELLIVTPHQEIRKQVQGGGAERFPITGPGQVVVRLQTATESDESVRYVARPGVQTVTASRLLILDKGQTARGEKVVAYASMGQVLEETIVALTNYPFG